MADRYNVPSYDKEYKPGEYPDLPAPTSNRGLWGWIKQNLFCDWMNGLVTIILVFFLAHSIPPVISWTFTHATAQGTTSQQCQIADRLHEFDQSKVAGNVAHAISVTPASMRVAGDAPSYWVQEGMAPAMQRFISSAVLFQSPNVESVLSAPAMSYPTVEKYLNNQALLLSSVDRNIKTIVEDQEREQAAIVERYDTSLKLINSADAASLANDPENLRTLYANLDQVLRSIDAQRLFNDLEPAIRAEAIAQYRPFRFSGTNNSEQYNLAREYFIEHFAVWKEGLTAAREGAIERNQRSLTSKTKALLTSVDLATIKKQWEAAIDNQNPEGIKQSLSALQPVMAWAEENSGACWTYPKERWWKAFTFGSYPEFEKWRPILVFVLLVIALIPALAPPFKGRNLLWIVTLAFPFVAYALMTGDTVYERFVREGVDGEIDWSLRVMLGLFLFGLAMLPTLFSKTLGRVFWFLWWGLITALAVLLVTGDALSKPLIEAFISNPTEFDPLENVNTGTWGGFMLNILLGVVGIFLSLPIGVALALGRRSTLPIIRVICTFFIELIRGVPLITILFMGALVFPYFVPPSWDVDAMPRMIVAVTMFSSAYMAEVIRGGLQGLDKGQYEGAAALGLGYWKAHRLIILPQALKIVIPGIVNTFIGLFKDTTLVSIVAVGLFESLGLHNSHIKGNADWRGVVTEGFVFVGVFFFICCFLMARYSIWLERRLDTGHRS